LGSIAQARIRREGAERALTLSDFCGLFGAEPESFTEEQVKTITTKDCFRVSELGQVETERVIIDVLKKINSPELTVAGDGGSNSRWERGWAENLADFDPSKGFETLRPKYVRSSQPVRLYQRFVMPENPDFEYEWYKIFLEYLARQYMGESDTVYEFGCGSGFNVAFLSQLFRNEKKVWGLDWAKSSVKIIDKMTEAGYNVEGRLFNFFEPDESFKLEEGAVVLTVGALEQTGSRYVSFLNYLLGQPINLCINIEPIVEWYDQNRLVDYLAVLFHERRKYMSGFPEALGGLANKGEISLVKQKRSYLGSLYIEGYSQNIWKPLR